MAFTGNSAMEGDTVQLSYNESYSNQKLCLNMKVIVLKSPHEKTLSPDEIESFLGTWLKGTHFELHWKIRVTLILSISMTYPCNPKPGSPQQILSIHGPFHFGNKKLRPKMRQN